MKQPHPCPPGGLPVSLSSSGTKERDSCVLPAICGKSLGLFLQCKQDKHGFFSHYIYLESDHWSSLSPHLCFKKKAEVRPDNPCVLSCEPLLQEAPHAAVGRGL